MTVDFNSLPVNTRIILAVCVGTALLVQSTCIFLSARKRGYNPWFWGFVGLLNIPSGTIIYLLFILYSNRQKRGD